MSGTHRIALAILALVFGPGDAAARAHTAAPEPTGVRVVRIESDPGFDWGDAAIGVGATLAAGTIAAGGALLVCARRRRADQPHLEEVR